MLMTRVQGARRWPFVGLKKKEKNGNTRRTSEVQDMKMLLVSEDDAQACAPGKCAARQITTKIRGGRRTETGPSVPAALRPIP